MRSMWKGHIRFSLVTIPIQIFNAVEKKNDISFKQLHNEDNGRVGYDKVCRSCNKKVPHTDIVKGYEYEPDKYVIIEKSELQSIKLKSTRVIDIEAFVDIAEVHPSRYEAVYYIGPNGPVASKTFNLFTQTLKKTGKAGIGRIILRDREDVVLIKAHENALIMYKLRYPDELRDINNVPDIVEEDIDKAQLKLAETLVASLETSFDEINFDDRYKDALLELVQDKVNGKEIISIVEDVDDKPVVDIMSALKQSIEQAKELKKGA